MGSEGYEDAEQDGSEGEGEDADDLAAGPGPGSAAAKKRKGSQRPDREPIYDVEAMHEKLEDFGWTDGTAWDETLVISHDDPTQVCAPHQHRAAGAGHYKLYALGHLQARHRPQRVLVHSVCGSSTA